MKVKNIRIHNRPAYNSEVHATRDMGVGELNNCYEDAELADTIVAVGTNALETQTNYFLNHWVPNLRGTSLDKKKAEFGSEPVAAGRIIIVDPRRTVTVNACEVEAGKDRVMHLAINSGTDLALFNAWLTYINEKGLTDKAFIAASTNDFDKAAAGNKTSLEEAAQITGLAVDQIRQSADWIAQPKQGGARRRTMFAYEKGLIWGNDNYRTNAALVNVALATGKSAVLAVAACAWAVTRRATRGLRMLMLAGRRRMSITADRRQRRRASHLGLRSLQDHTQRTEIQAGLQEAYGHGEGCNVRGALWGPCCIDQRHRRRHQKWRLVRSGRRYRADQIGQACHVWLPAATSGEQT